MAADGRERLLEQAAWIGDQITRAYGPLLEAAAKGCDQERFAELTNQMRTAIENNTRHIVTLMAAEPVRVWIPLNPQP